MTTIPATKARKNFFKLIDENSKPGRSTFISVDGVPKVVMMSAEDFEGWMETLEIMSDPKLMKELEESKKEFKEGKFSSLEDVEKELKGK